MHCSQGFKSACIWVWPLLWSALLGLLVLLLAVTPMPVHGQSLTASADAQSVEVGYTIGVTFTLDRIEAQRFSPPAFDGFKVVSGPNEAFSTSIHNGKVSQSQSWNYLLMAIEPGSFEIGAARVETKVGAFDSRPLQIHVKGPSATTENAKALAARGEKIFIQSRLSVDSAYIGQCVRLDHVLHTRIPVESFQIMHESKHSDFFARDLRRFDVQNGEKNLGKYTYSTRTLRSVSLIPQKTGLHVIESSSYQLGVEAEPGKSAPRDPFGRLLGRSFKPLTLTTTPAHLVVKPLPDGAPASFCGLVGNYELKVQTDQKNLTSDESFVIRVRITGDGDPRIIKMPELDLGQQLEVYPPKLVSDESWESDNRGFYHESIYEYYVIPKSTGDHHIQPEIAVFEPHQGKYVLLKSDPITVSVAKGSGIKPHKPQKQSSDSPGSYKKWLLLIMLPLGLYLILQQLRKKSAPKTDLEWPARQPSKASTPLLEETPLQTKSPAHAAIPNPTKLDLPDTAASPNAFYKQLSSFICKQLGAQSVKEVQQNLSMRPHTSAQVLLELLEQSEWVQYGGANPETPQEEVLRRADEALRHLREL